MIDLPISEPRVDSCRTNKCVAREIGELVGRNAAWKQCQGEFVKELLQVGMRAFRQPWSSLSA